MKWLNERKLLLCIFSVLLFLLVCQYSYTEDNKPKFENIYQLLNRLKAETQVLRNRLLEAQNMLEQSANDLIESKKLIEQQQTELQKALDQLQQSNSLLQQLKTQLKSWKTATLLTGISCVAGGVLIGLLLSR